MIGANTLINILISLLIFGVLFWAIDYFSAILRLPAVLVTVVRVVLVVFFIIYLLKLLGLFAGLAVG